MHPALDLRRQTKPGKIYALTHLFIFCHTPRRPKSDLLFAGVTQNSPPLSVCLLVFMSVSPLWTCTRATKSNARDVRTRSSETRCSMFFPPLVWKTRTHRHTPSPPRLHSFLRVSKHEAKRKSRDGERSIFFTRTQTKARKKKKKRDATPCRTFCIHSGRAFGFRCWRYVTILERISLREGMSLLDCHERPLPVA